MVGVRLFESQVHVAVLPFTPNLGVQWSARESNPEGQRHEVYSLARLHNGLSLRVVLDPEMTEAASVSLGGFDSLCGYRSRLSTHLQIGETAGGGGDEVCAIQALFRHRRLLSLDA